MLEPGHSYYCYYCRRFLEGDAPKSLAARVNAHNKQRHPMDYDGWTADNVVHSALYSGPNKAAEKPQLSMQPVRADWGNAKEEPKITDADRAFLKRWNVRW